MNEMHSKSALVIEDEHGLRAVVAILLEDIGFRVFEAADSKEAAIIWQEQKSHLDLVLSDVVLPGLSGPGIVTEFLRDRPDLNIVFMSGVESLLLALIEKTSKCGILRKPFTPRSMRDAIDRVPRAQHKTDEARCKANVGCARPLYEPARVV
jgi:two-component system cell cycle sensor histidine kinase/response regulator CckA